MTAVRSTLRARLLGWLLVILLAWSAQVLGWRSLRLRWLCHQALNGSAAERQEALRALGGAEDASVLPVLMQAMRRDDFNDAGNWRAAFAVMRYEGDALPHLARALEHEPMPHVRKLVVVMLVAMLMERAEPYLERAQRDPHPEVRRWALLSALNRGLGWELRARLARRSFEDPDAGVRAAAATIVRDRRDTTILAILERQAEDREASPRVTATAVLAWLGYRQYYPRLVAFLRSPQPHAMSYQTVGQYAAESLEMLVQFIVTDDAGPELEDLGRTTHTLAHEPGTEEERADLERQWSEWLAANQGRLVWNERDGWALAAR